MRNMTFEMFRRYSPDTQRDFIEHYESLPPEYKLFIRLNLNQLSKDLYNDNMTVHNRGDLLPYVKKANVSFDITDNKCVDIGRIRTLNIIGSHKIRGYITQYLRPLVDVSVFNIPSLRDFELSCNKLCVDNEKQSMSANGLLEQKIVMRCLIDELSKFKMESFRILSNKLESANDVYQINNEVEFKMLAASDNRLYMVFTALDLILYGRHRLDEARVPLEYASLLYVYESILGLKCEKFRKAFYYKYFAKQEIYINMIECINVFNNENMSIIDVLDNVSIIKTNDDIQQPSNSKLIDDPMYLEINRKIVYGDNIFADKTHPDMDVALYHIDESVISKYFKGHIIIKLTEQELMAIKYENQFDGIVSLYDSKNTITKTLIALDNKIYLLFKTSLDKTIYGFPCNKESLMGDADIEAIKLVIRCDYKLAYPTKQIF